MKEITTSWLQKAIKKARPLTPTALALRLSSLPRYRGIQPAFLKTVAEIVEGKSDASSRMYPYFHESWKELPFEVRMLIWIAERLVPYALTDWALGLVVHKMLVPNFLVKDAEAYETARKDCVRDGTNMILDIVGEKAHTWADADRYMKSYKDTMEKYPGRISVKPSSLLPEECFENNTFDENKWLLKSRLVEIFTWAENTGCSVMVDAEEYFKWCKLTEEAFLETVGNQYFCGSKTEFGIVLQTYRKDALLSAKAIIAAAKNRRGCPLRVRVVKGAYWGEEYAEAEKRSEEYPLFTDKRGTDGSFAAAVSHFAAERKYIHLSIGTHNAMSIAFAVAAMKDDFSHFEVELLTGMCEAIRRVLRKLGVPVSIYYPLIRMGGQIQEGMAYLLRRLDEVAMSSAVLGNI